MLTRNGGVVRAAVLVLGLCGGLERAANAAPITWIGGNNDWLDGGSTTFWNPADEPDTDDTAIFNTADAVHLGSNNSILALTLSGGIDLFTNDFNLTVNGLVQLGGSSTFLVVGGANSLVAADSVTINSSGRLQLEGGAVQIVEESGSGLLDINAGGELTGYGTLTMADAVAIGTTLIINDGTISARHTSQLLFGTPPVDTLILNASDADTRIDLDGASETGAVNVTRNQTLDLNIALADAFSGTLTMTQDATLDMANAWTLNTTGVINADNGFIAGNFPLPNTPAGTSTIAGAAFTQAGGTINVVDNDGTLKFDAPFTMDSGTLNNNGLVIFNADATIAAGANFNMGSSTSSLTVEAGRTLLIQQTNFNFDGTIIGGSIITVNPGGSLTITSNDYDSDSVVNAFNGVMNLNSGAVITDTGDAEFVMDGVLNMNNTTGTAPTWNGEPLDIGNDSGLLNADLNILGPGFHDFVEPVDFNSDADVDVPAGSTLRFLTNSTVSFDTVNGANNAEFTGAGTISFSGAVNVNEAVTLNMVGGTVDLDGVDGIGDFINIDAPLTINAATLSNFGRANAGGGTNTLDVNNSVGTGVLTVNLDDPAANWTLNGPGVLNLVNDNTAATLLAGSDVNLNGTVNVTGDVRIEARVDIAGVVNINTVNEPLRLAGGISNDTNTLNGGTISGAGLLGADAGVTLSGHGTINTSIDFDGIANLWAQGGTLTLNGGIIDVNLIGAADETGTLQVTNPWSANAGTVVTVVVNGGVLAGATVTLNNPNGLQGYGTVSAPVINNSQITAANGSKLVVETAGNNNDWDGAGGSGALKAINADLELRDNATFGFTGTVTAANGHEVFTNGFSLDFDPGSTLSMQQAGRLRSTSSTDLGGTVTIGTGPASTIQVQNNFFLTFEPTCTATLNADLILLNNNVNIQAGATFGGTGALIVPQGSHLVMAANANANVLLALGGAFRPGNFDGVGRVDLRDYQQTGTGVLFAEITGTALNQFDRLVINGAALLDGVLVVDIDGGFVPAVNNTFNIISASGGVTGVFSEIQTSGLPAGRTVKVVYSPTVVQLQIVPIVPLALDFDGNGYVNNDDLQYMRQCFTGPSVPGPAIGCALSWHQAADVDDDGDVDMADFGRFQRCYTGPALITDPNCAD